MYVFPSLLSPVDILPVSPVVVVYDLRSKVGIFSIRPKKAPEIFPDASSLFTK